MIFGNAEIKIIQKVENGFVVTVTKGKGSLKFQWIDEKWDSDKMTQEGVLTLNNMPIVQITPTLCPTCCGLLATGYGIENADCNELKSISEKINSGFESLEDSLETLKPLLGLLEDGVYYIKDTQTFPTDGDGIFFWAVPDEMKYYNAFVEEYYISDLWQCEELEGRFLYPTQSPEKYDESRVQHYMDIFSSSGENPRAIAYNEMGGMCALLDGHHKACAAARLHMPLDTIMITKGYIYRDMQNIRIRFKGFGEKKLDLLVDKNCGLPTKIYNSIVNYMKMLHSRTYKPTIYKGMPVESYFKARNWEKFYTDSVKLYPTANEYAVEKVCITAEIENMTADELFSYVLSQKRNDFDNKITTYATAIMKNLTRTNDRRSRDFLLKFVELPVLPDTKILIGTALKCLMNFKDEETEKIFIDFTVCDEKYLSDIAMDYWEDEK